MARKTLSKTRFVPARSKRFTTILLIVSTIIAAIAGGSFVYVFANPGSTLYVEEGVYPGSPSYTIWREDSTYYSKDENGHIAYTSSNFSYLMQTSMDALPQLGGDMGGGTIYLLQGQYVVNTQLIVPWHRIAIIGEGIESTILDTSATVTGSVIRFADYTYGTYWNRIENLAIDGYSSPTITGIDFDGVDSCVLNNIRIRGFNGVGGIGLRLRVSDTYTRGCYYNNFYNIYISWCRTGILYNGTASVKMNMNNHYGGWIQHCYDAHVNLTHAKGNNFYGVNVENYEGTQGYWLGRDAIQNNFWGGWIEDAGAVTGFNFTSQAPTDPHGNLIWNVRFYLPSGTKVSDNTSSKTNTWVYSDEANGDFRIFPSYIAFGDATGSTWAQISTYYGAVHVEAGLRIDGYVTYVPRTHPSTTGWGASEAGRMWFCSDHNTMEYWDGSSVQSFP